MKTKILFLSIIFLGLFGFVKTSQAERFFQTNNTWYEKIPASPTITANSANYVADILTNANWMYINNQYFSVPIFHAASNAPITTVTVTTTNQTHKTYIEANDWNDVPIPAGALPAGNSLACAGTYVDGHMVIISYDNHWAWEFYRAKYCNGVWSTSTVRKWDLTGDGINSPYDGHSTQRHSSVPLLHGVITYDEVVNEGKINHALAFAYSANRQALHQGIYPDGQYQGGTCTRTWCMKMSMRIQLDPSVDCNSLGLNNVGKMVCVALQEYGMIFVENTSPGNNYVYAEYLANQPSKSWTGIMGTNQALGIPMNQLRIVEPIYPGIVVDTNVPANPTGLRVQ